MTLPDFSFMEFLSPLYCEAMCFTHRVLSRLLNLATELLDRALVLRHVLLVLLLENFDHVLHHPLIEVLAVEMGGA